MILPTAIALWVWAGQIPLATEAELPGGQKVGPGDIAEFDKRKWDKFLVTLTIKDSHPTLGGQRVVVDLYRHEPVEDWILAMERTAFPETAGPKGEDGRAEESASGSQ